MKPQRLVLIAALLLVALSGLGNFTPTFAARPPLVLAFYYAWFDENTWRPGQVADMPVTPYTSRDPQAIARQIQQARNAGIDAFVVSWWGANNPTDSNFKVILDQAQATNFRVAIDFEVTSPFYQTRDTVVNSLKSLLATYAQHPAYLRVDGKPVIFFWREQKYPVDVWKSIRAALDPNHQSLWIAEGIKEQLPYLSVFDGLHLYSIGWASNVAVELQKWPDRVRSYGADKLWVATVMPGNDDTRTRRVGSYMRDRRGGEFYREAWRGAFSTSPDLIVITSWNEWVEGTQIEPSVTYGDLYLNITREFAAQFKAGLPASSMAPPKPSSTLAPTRTPSPTRTVTPTRTPSPTPTLMPGAVRGKATDALRVRAQPSTDSKIVGRLSEGAMVAILGKTLDEQWWQIAYPDADQRGWVASEFASPAGDTSALPVIQTAPPATPTLTVIFITSEIANNLESEDNPPVLTVPPLGDILVVP